MQVGTAPWFEQHDWLEQLNLQAHLNTQTHSDEYVKEALLSHDALTPLVRELLVAEASWVLGAGRAVAACTAPRLPALRQQLTLFSPLPPCTQRQVWRERVLPHLEVHLAAAVDSVAAYQLLYHEAALANLLEVGAG